MKNIKNIVILMIISTLFIACGNRVPFKEKEPLKNAALVYVYVEGNVGTEEGDSDSDYSIRINNKIYLQRVVADEYVVFDLKPQAMTISATKKQIEEKVLNLNLKAGQIYYLKISDNLDGGNFDFEVVSNSIGSKEVALTGEAGTSVDSPENIITEFVTGEDTPEESVLVKGTQMNKEQVNAMIEKKLAKQAPTQSVSSPVVNSSVSTGSKLQEIQKAYKLKEQGILTDSEFQKIKTEILSK